MTKTYFLITIGFFILGSCVNKKPAIQYSLNEIRMIKSKETDKANYKDYVSWGVQLGTKGEENFHAVVCDNDNNPVVCGETGGKLGNRHFGDLDGLVVKYSPDGNTLWIRQMGSHSKDTFKNICIDKEGDYLLVGYSEGDFENNKNLGRSDAIIAKMSPKGKIIWVKQFGTDDLDEATAVVVDKKNNYYIAGNTRGKIGDIKKGVQDVFVLKMDSSGKILWKQQCGTKTRDNVNSMHIDQKNRIFIANSYYKSSVSSIIIMDTNGKIIKEKEDKKLKYWDIYVDKQKNIFACGHTKNAGFIEKLNPSMEEDWISTFRTPSGWSGEKKIVPLGNDLYATSGCMNWRQCYGFIRVYNNKGEKIASIELNKPSTCGNLLAVDKEGDFYHSGSTETDLFAENKGNHDAYLVKVKKSLITQK